MRGARETLPWFLLVPYFAVFSLNVTPWLGEERRSANRTNAQLAVALVFATIALPLLKAVGVTGGSIVRTHPWLLGLGLIVPPMVAVSLWLNGRREAEYHKAYRAMALPPRAAFGLTTFVVVGVALWLFFSS